jgi:hypothetical protein
MKTKAPILIVVLGLVAALAGCVMNPMSSEPETIVLREDAGASLSVEIEPGEQWRSRMQAGPFIFNVLPQFAIWTEDDAGTLVETLYVTGAGFTKTRHAEKNEMQAEFYLQTLPVWSARVTASGSALPSKTNPYPDAVTSATPSGPACLGCRSIPFRSSGPQATPIPTGFSSKTWPAPRYPSTQLRRPSPIASSVVTRSAWISLSKP